MADPVSLHGVFFEVRVDLERVGVEKHDKKSVVLMQIDPPACLVSYYAKSTKPVTIYEPLYSITYDNILGAEVSEQSEVITVKASGKHAGKILEIPHVLIGCGSAAGQKDRNVFALFFNTIKHANAHKQVAASNLAVGSYFVSTYYRNEHFEDVICKKAGVFAKDRRLVVYNHSIYMLKSADSLIPVHVFPLSTTNIISKGKLGIELHIPSSEDKHISKQWGTEGYSNTFEFESVEARTKFLTSCSDAVALSEGIREQAAATIVADARNPPKKAARATKLVGGTGVVPTMTF